MTIATDKEHVDNLAVDATHVYWSGYFSYRAPKQSSLARRGLLCLAHVLDSRRDVRGDRTYSTSEERRSKPSLPMALYSRRSELRLGE